MIIKNVRLEFTLPQDLKDKLLMDSLRLHFKNPSAYLRELIKVGLPSADLVKHDRKSDFILKIVFANFLVNTNIFSVLYDNFSDTEMDKSKAIRKELEEKLNFDISKLFSEFIDKNIFRFPSGKIFD